MLLPDGRILTAGGSRFIAARYMPDGLLDETYGAGGIAEIDFATEVQEVHAAALQPDQKLIVVGVVGSNTAQTLDFGVARYTEHGILDVTFGGSGKIVADAGNDSESPWSVALQGSSILVSGASGTNSFTSSCTVLRFFEDGTPDPAFAEGGRLVVGLGGQCIASRVLVRPGGRLLVFGTACSGTGRCWFLSGFLSDGGVDGSIGTVTTNLLTTDIGADLALQEGGRAVGVGGACTPCTFGLARYLTTNCGDGTVETEEECDDANTTEGDACDSNCTTSRCGNGIVGENELCDDGNTSDSDGCDANCQLEPGWVCGGQPYRCARDRRVSGERLALTRTRFGKEKALFICRDPSVLFPTPAGADDPRVSGATVHLLSPREAGASFALPATHWTLNDAGTVYRFVNASAPDAVSAVKHAVIKRGKGIKISGKGVGLLLKDRQESVAIRLSTGLVRNCALFDGQTIRRSQPDSFVAKGALGSALADCWDANLVGSESGASLD